MKIDNSATYTIEKGVYVVRSQEELETDVENSRRKYSIKSVRSQNVSNLRVWFDKNVPILLHYVVLFILGLHLWGIFWITWGEGWSVNGTWFRMVLVTIVSWASGVLFQSTTTLPPQLPPLIIGILVRHFGYLNMRHHPEIEVFLRKIYPCIILGKNSLSWNYDYMKTNCLDVALLGLLPWLAEIIAMAVSMNLLLGHPWLWGLSFGCMFASVTGPVILPTVVSITQGLPRKWPLICISSGGIDLALSVGVYGIIRSFMAIDVSDVHRYIKLFMSAFAAIGIGGVWGYLGGFIPHANDFYVVELRVLYILFGGLFFNFFTAYVGWGGCGAIAILILNSTATRQWVKRGWVHAKNPAVTAYRAMWSACEPALFSFTGTYFEMNQVTLDTLKYGFAVLLICLTVRLIVAAGVSRNMTLKERLFVCCCWSPKTIVQAVICPLALIQIQLEGGSDLEILYAEQIITITVLTILVTTPLAFLATTYLGPILLKTKSKDDAGP